MRREGFGELRVQCASNGTSRLGTIFADVSSSFSSEAKVELLSLILCEFDL